MKRKYFLIAIALIGIFVLGIFFNPMFAANGETRSMADLAWNEEHHVLKRETTSNEGWLHEPMYDGLNSSKAVSNPKLEGKATDSASLEKGTSGIFGQKILQGKKEQPRVHKEVPNVKDETFICPFTGAKAGMRPGMNFKMSMHSVIAKALDMTEQELYTARHEEGKSLADLASEKGLETEDLLDKLVAARKSEMQKLVDQGTITQAQMDRMLENFTEKMTVNMEKDTVGRMHYGDGHGHGGKGKGSNCYRHQVR